MDSFQLIAIVAMLFLAYTWVGYPALIILLPRLLASPPARSAIHPYVTLILAVHNEEACIEEKLMDCLQLKYPLERIEFLIASDNSNDKTEEMVEQFAKRDPRIRLLRTGLRAGKSGAQNLAVAHATGEILFFTDANTRIDPAGLEQLIENFVDPRVGLVTATVNFLQPGGAVPKSQGLYWRYELFIRQAESDLGILAKASGQAFAIRRNLFRPMQTCYGDDCVLPLEVRIQGYRVVHEPRAVVTDTMPHTLGGEMRARIRMTARNWTGTLSHISILNPFLFPITSWALISHKLLRWMSPFFLFVLLAANIMTALHSKWVWLCLLQVTFYLSAAFGWLCVRRGKGAGVFGYSFAFCLANLGFFLGFVRALRSQRIVAY